MTSSLAGPASSESVQVMIPIRPSSRPRPARHLRSSVFVLSVHWVRRLGRVVRLSLLLVVADGWVVIVLLLVLLGLHLVRVQVLHSF